MPTPLVFATLGLITVGLGVGLRIGQRRLDQHIAAVVEELLAAAEAPSSPPARTRGANVDEPPVPVQRYLSHVLRNDLPAVQAVKLTQKGTFRSGGAGSSWHDFTATQHVTIQPPGFAWNASIRMLPGLSVRVLDAYADGQGMLWTRLGGVVPVANPAPGPSLDEGELLRYLAEAPLYPTALRPDAGVRWTAVTDRSARATLNHRGTTASLLFHFNDQNEVERVIGKRPFLKSDGTTERRSWIGTWRNYEPRGGLRVPTDGEVAWIFPEGKVSYWRGHIETIEYQLAPHENRDRSFTSASS